jgi:hypothetical protein
MLWQNFQIYYNFWILGLLTEKKKGILLVGLDHTHQVAKGWDQEEIINHELESPS